MIDEIYSELFFEKITKYAIKYLHSLDYKHQYLFFYSQLGCYKQMMREIAIVDYLYSSYTAM